MRTVWVIDNDEFSRIHAALAARKLGLNAEFLMESDWPESAQRFDLVIAAESSPNGLFRSALHRYREANPELRVALLSAETELECWGRVDEFGLAVLPKPLTAGKLLEWMLWADHQAGDLGGIP